MAAAPAPRADDDGRAADDGRADWQRLDVWLWSARFMKTRADCARLAGQGSLRLNRQPTDKAHARLRVGDVITLPLHGRVMVLEVLALASRRGPASEARLLYRELSESSNAALRPHTCGSAETTAYPGDPILSSTRSPR
jgi:ribosome-associated heat shock protein Hsp15